MKKIEEKINKEISILESKGHKIINVKTSIFRDAAIEAKIKMGYTLTAAILYE